ncbi:MAG: hypothetical protein IPP86_16680 [Bacteroidetes bacterium]|nr:hypothetical protein [Bacteroidota bacterium]
MRKLNLVFLICLSIQVSSVCETYGQFNQNDTTILLKAFRQITSQRQIVYVDTVGPNSYVQEKLQEAFKKDTIIDKRRGNSITLTESEMNHIISQLGKETIWYDNLFFNCKRIDSDSLLSVAKQMYAERVQSLNEAILKKDTARIKDLKQNYSYVFEFTKPIYIRDNTICLISFNAMCGLDCGQSETSFYKKDEGEWTKWVLVSSGDF